MDANRNSHVASGVNFDRGLIEDKNGFGLNKNSQNLNLKKTDFTFIDQTLVGSDFAKHRMEAEGASPGRSTSAAFKSKGMSGTEMTFSKLLGNGTGAQVPAKVLTVKSSMGPEI